MTKLFNKKLMLLAFALVFSGIANAADCTKIFNQLDKQSHEISGKDTVKKLIAVEDALFKAIEQCKTFSGMFVLMGEVQIDMGQVQLAVVYGRKAVELDPEYWRAYKLLGTSRMLNKETESGVKALKKAYSLQPENTNVQLNLVSALIEIKKYDEALGLVNKLIELNDPDIIAMAYYFRGQTYMGKGLVIEAGKDAERAQELGFSVR